jgi:hypothetical protein
MKIVAGSLLLASAFAQATWATNHLSLDVAQNGYIRGGRYANNNYQTINPDAFSASQERLTHFSNPLK